MILDVNLPGRGGLDLLTESKRRCPRMAVLVLSAYPEEEFGLRCLRLGADGYVEKSNRSAEIVSAVRRVLGGGKYVSPVLAEQLASAAQRSIGAVPHHLLSARELQVLKLVARGRTLREISSELQLGERTIATYRARLREKLGVSTNVEITRYALRHDLVD
jgi:DNA-binding NarL/FixJ family response regulator